MDINEKEEKLLEELGAEGFLDALLCQMSYDEKAEAFAYIAQMYDVDIEDEEEEEEEDDE